MKTKINQPEKVSSGAAFVITPAYLAKVYSGIGAHGVSVEKNMGNIRFVLPWVFAPWEMNGSDHLCRQLEFTWRRPGVIVLMFRVLWPWYVDQLYAELRRTCSITPESFERMYLDSSRVAVMGARRRICIPKEIASYLNFEKCRYLILRGRSAFIEIMSKDDYEAGASAAQAEVAKIPSGTFTPVPGNSLVVP